MLSVFPSVPGNSPKTPSRSTCCLLKSGFTYWQYTPTMSSAPELIAIIGMAFKFPGGAETSQDFWDMLLHRRSAATELPKDRFDIDAHWQGHQGTKKLNTITPREGHFLTSDIHNLDAAFFSLAPDQVSSMDPQQRGLLETTYHAFENAGLTLSEISGTKTSVHVGCFTSDFATLQFQDAQNIPKYNSLGTAGSMLANRLSWFYDLRGESMYIDTACSSSLVALSKACQGLTSGESEMAVVGGSNIILIPEFSISLSNMSFLSPGGKSKSFDAAGDGYGRGEGIATLILQPLSKALAAKNPIRAIIRSVALNQDGYTSGGITQPSKDMQVRLIREAYSNAGLDMKHTRFFEAHGTGTAVGDPIEARAIGEAFFRARSKDDPIYVGAVKSNIGHLEGTSGLAAVIKTILALEHGIIPPNTNFEKLNPQIDADFFNMRFPTTPIPWPTVPGGPDIRRASINSFGFGGANAHVVLEAIEGYLQSIGYDEPLSHVTSSTLSQPAANGVNGYRRSEEEVANDHTNGRSAITEMTSDGTHPQKRKAIPEISGQNKRRALTTNGTHPQPNSVAIPDTKADSKNPPQELDPFTPTSFPKLLILTAADEEGITRQAAALSESTSLSSSSGAHMFPDIVHTLNTHRTIHPFKSFAVLPSPDLTTLPVSLSKPLKPSGNIKLGMVFTGQGAQWARMGIELLPWPLFSASIQRSSKYLNMLGCEWSLMQELFASSDKSRLNNPEFSQAITTAVQIALVDLMADFGVSEPTVVVVGHSSGEIAAAYCAGFLCHESAMRVSYFRGLLASKLARESESHWGMASIGIPTGQLPQELVELEKGSNAGTNLQINVSCINSPSNTTVSGPSEALDLLLAHLSSKDIFTRRLKVDVGYHSPQMEAVATEYLSYLSNLHPGSTGQKTTKVKMVSSVTTRFLSSEEACSGAYWVQNMVSPVRFTEAISLCCATAPSDDMPKLLDLSHKHTITTHGWLEIGPHSALQGPLRDIWRSLSRNDLCYVSTLVRNKPASTTMLSAAGELFCRGVPLNLSAVNPILAGSNPPRVVVDLPAYPFNHSTIHWSESARSRAARARRHPHHPLLGFPVLDFNPLDAKWRLVLKTDDLPWIADHRISGALWYPAAGMVVMAVEALKQLLSDQQQADFDIELRNVSFTSPIVITEGASEGTEVQISLLPATMGTAGGGGGGGRSGEREFKFRIFARRPDDSWDEVCDGIIAPVWEVRTTQGQAADEDAPFDEVLYKRHQAQSAYAHVVESCQGNSLDGGEMYRKLAEDSGLQYGPAFRLLDDIHYDRHSRAHAKVVPLEKPVMDVSKPYTIHPATLDVIFQLAIPALSQGRKDSLSTLVPSRLTRLWISREASSSDKQERTGAILTHADAKFTSKRSAAASMSAFSEHDMQLRVVVEDLEVTEASRDQNNQGANTEQGVRMLCHELDWKVDPALLSTDGMLEYCSQFRNSVEAEPEQWYLDVRRMLLGFASQALKAIGAGASSKHKGRIIPSMLRYAAWLQARLDEAASGSPKLLLPSTTELEELAARFESDGHRGLLLVLVARQLQDMLVGAIDPLQTLFAGEGQRYLTNFYEEGNMVGKAFPMLRAYLDVLVHKDPGLKFLEVGAGTGATTSMVLDMIANPENGGHRYGEYVFTDISSFFFSAAQERFQCCEDKMQYLTLDVENPDLAAQGFEGKQYDVLVAAHVVHATKDLVATLANVRKLLKPGGKLILVEMTTPHSPETGFVWGSLAGWWLGTESFRQNSGALIDEKRWDSVLREAGFSGTELVFRDWDSDVCHGWSVMISSAAAPMVSVDVHPATRRLPVTFIAEDGHTDGLQMRTAKRIQEALGSTCAAEVVLFDQIASADLGSRQCILLVDLDKSHLHAPEPEFFQFYQELIRTSRSILWVQTYNPEPADQQPPHWAMVEGFTRVFRSENPLLKIVTLTVQNNSVDTASTALADKIARHVITVLHAAESSLREGQEDEYLEVQGQLCINRLRQANYIDQHIFDRTRNPVRLRPFGAGPPLELTIRHPGLLDTIEWVEDKSAYVDLAPTQVEVQVRAIGVNFKDSLTLLGRVNNDKLGSECAGHITRVGCAVTCVKPGDAVAVGTLATYKSLVRVQEASVARIPGNMSLEEAAGIATAFCTAHHSLYNVARLQKGETILIHAAAGGTGQAAVQIAQHIGAEVYATVSSAPKRKLMMERYNIPADHIFSSRDDSFADGVLRMTGGQGVDVVLNSLAGKLLVASWEVIAEFGRFIEIGRKDIDTRGNLPMFPFRRNAMFAGIDLATLVDTDTGVILSSKRTKSNIANTMKEVFQMLENGILRPAYPVQTFPIDRAEEAFRLLVSGKSTGKIVLTTGPEDMVPVKESDDSNYRFSKQKTYVIAGGLGGIGRQIARWMARRGASNILLLSRSGAGQNPERLATVAELEARGVRLEYGVCDISNLESVQEALRLAAAKGMPPVKGCFQAAMVIRDRTFAGMTGEEWRESVQPKVQGSWNLHLALPKGMDFFVMLSSAVCIFGNAGQGNYAAGNTFLDQLARLRVARGEKAVAIDLGMVLDEGWVAEHKDIANRVLQFDHIMPISQPELFAMLDYYCNPDRVFASPTASQIVTGIELPALIERAGRQIPECLSRPLFRAMYQVPVGAWGEDQDENRKTSGSGVTQNFADIFRASDSLAEAGEAVAEALKVRLCKILGLDAADKTIQHAMDSFGVDSLIALEVRNWLAKEVRADMAVYEILGDVKLIDTGLTAARKSEFRRAEWELEKGKA
ncbi:hypothetical protein QBC35DRAFT_125003 [Podospora australis]|uniref:Polyketide synthase n=1 Tax=Podospora australis TaxID=1536484 RepID=A0AAN6WMT3_9PEZI|nr:hypothetical protein QBC35DRAFT_125003 [Podospora australis]